MTNLTAIYEEEKCPQCKSYAPLDAYAGPGKHYWCPYCKDYTKNIRTSLSRDTALESLRRKENDTY